MAIELRTERLWLRPLALADREELHRHWTGREVRRFLWDDRVIDLASVDDVIARSAASLVAEGFCLFTLRESEPGALLGACGLWRMAPDLEPELLYSLEPSAWGRGLVTEAARSVIEDVFSRLGHARVLARADAPNRASLAVMERLGMAFEGERVEGAQQLVSYTLARDAWLRRSR